MIMLERVTEKARRVIFFARYEASQYGSPIIETDHLLLGLAREDRWLVNHVLGDRATIEDIRRQIESRITIRDPISTSVEVPLSAESKRVLARATEFADNIGQKHVSTEHILLGLVAVAPQIRADLEKLGLAESELPERIAKAVGERPARQSLQTENRAFAGIASTTRAGIGYDLHRLEPGHRLMIGGVEVPFEKGPVGHSDGDVLAHAICDALLGAAGLGDIGTHFPDTDPKWNGANSLVFLEHLRKLFAEKGLQIFHLDAVVITERPKLGPHFPVMRVAIAKALGIAPECVSLKAKTNEGVDAIGRGEAIAAHAVATIGG
jgi:2-C-methyl-D-erythritol 2,4-cyclodiphosphate synthase